jgi:hypothetical protein
VGSWQIVIAGLDVPLASSLCPHFPKYYFPAFDSCVGERGLVVDDSSTKDTEWVESP